MIKSVERLRAAIEAERVAAAKVAGWHSYEIETQYQEAVKATDRAVAKVERQLENAAEATRGRRERGEEGIPTPSGRGDGGMVGYEGVVGHSMNIVVQPGPDPRVVAAAAVQNALRRGQVHL